MSLHRDCVLVELLPQEYGKKQFGGSPTQEAGVQKMGLLGPGLSLDCNATLPHVGNLDFLAEPFQKVEGLK